MKPKSDPFFDDTIVEGVRRCRDKFLKNGDCQELLTAAANIIVCANMLRDAQRRYMIARANPDKINKTTCEERGKQVALAAENYDDEVLLWELRHSPKGDRRDTP